VSLPTGEIGVVVESLGATDLGGEPSRKIQGRSLADIAWRSLKRDKVAMAGGIFALFIVLVAIFAGPLTHLYGQRPSASFLELTSPDTTMPNGALGGVSGTHWLGVTPVLANDILAQLIYGARTSLVIASLATALSLLFGVTLGLMAGYYRGWSDGLISRIMDLLLSFPTLLFSIALITVFSIVDSFAGLSGQPLRFAVIIFVLGFFGFPYIGRIVRGQVLSIREREFVDAARSLGASNYRIMTREIFPNVLGPILVYTTLTIPNYMLGEAGLSFLGVGVLPPTPSWGQMLANAGQFYQVDPAYLFWPGMAIFVSVLSFNLFGDGLRDALDPKSMR